MLFLSQYAVKNGKIPVTYIDDVNRLKQIFIGDSDKYEFLFDNFRELIVRIDELLDNEDKVNEIKDKIGELLISEDQFKDEFKKCIDNHSTSFTYDMKEDDHLDYKKTSLDRCADDYDLLFKILDKKISNLSYEKFFYLHMYHKGKILLNRLWKNKERR